jgi:hypothetical protein
LDAWLGRFAGSMLTSDIGNLLDNSAMQLGDMVAEFSAAFEGLLSATTAVRWVSRQKRSPGC